MNIGINLCFSNFYHHEIPPSPFDFLASFCATVLGKRGSFFAVLRTMYLYASHLNINAQKKDHQSSDQKMPLLRLYEAICLEIQPKETLGAECG